MPLRLRQTQLGHYEMVMPTVLCEVNVPMGNGACMSSHSPCVTRSPWLLLYHSTVHVFLILFAPGFFYSYPYSNFSFVLC